MARTRTLPEALAEAAQSEAGYIFVASGRETRRSYAEIYEASRRVSRGLRSLGLGHGDLVARFGNTHFAAEAMYWRCRAL